MYFSDTVSNERYPLVRIDALPMSVAEYQYTCFFFIVSAATEIYHISLHDALPISLTGGGRKKRSSSKSKKSMSNSLNNAMNNVVHKKKSRSSGKKNRKPRKSSKSKSSGKKKRSSRSKRINSRRKP